MRRRPSPSSNALRWPVLWAALAAGTPLAGTTALGAEPPALLGLSIAAATGRVSPLGKVLGDGPAIVAAWATYCAPCQLEVPVLARAARRWRSAGVRVVAILTDINDPARLAYVVREWGIEIDVYGVSADQQDLLGRVLPSGLPATFFVRGPEVTRVDRLLSDSDLVELVDQHLGVAAGAASGASSPGASQGRLYYLRYCASCHGAAADGHGPVARTLRTAPTDLRRLGERWGMPLPAERIARTIDGRDPIAAHGGRELPVWGVRLGATEADRAERDADAGQRLAAIVAYLESVQGTAAP